MWYPLERGIATRSSMLAWRIPWTEEPAGLQSMGSQRVGHGWSDWARTPQQTLMRLTGKEKLTVAILKGAHGWESSLPNRVEGLQPLETASSTRGSHQPPGAEADRHSAALRLRPQRENKVKVRLPWSGTGRWTWHQSWLRHGSQLPHRKLRVRWWPGRVQWIPNDTVSLVGGWPPPQRSRECAWARGGGLRGPGHSVAKQPPAQQ